MHSKSVVIIFLLVIVFSILSCNPENDCDLYGPQTFTFKIKIIDEDGNDLVFSENALYDPSDITLRDFSQHPLCDAALVTFDEENPDKELRVITVKFDQLLLILNEQEVDTLRFRYKEVIEECFDELTVYYNDQLGCENCTIDKTITVIK